MEPSSVERAREIVSTLETRGVPNGFGYQRFGKRRNTRVLGRAILRRDAEAFVRSFLGEPAPDDDDAERTARAFVAEGDYAGRSGCGLAACGLSARCSPRWHRATRSELPSPDSAAG